VKHRLFTTTKHIVETTAQTGHCQSSAIIHYSQQVAADSSFNEHRLNDSVLNTHNNKPDIEMSSEYSSSAVQTAVELHLEQSKKKITLT